MRFYDSSIFNGAAHDQWLNFLTQLNTECYKNKDEAFVNGGESRFLDL